jgi:hypothetical protein
LDKKHRPGAGAPISQLSDSVGSLPHRLSKI